MPSHGANRSPIATQHLPPKLQDSLADPGVYLPDGLHGLGPGWYHFGGPGHQTFRGHPGETDVFIFDFGVTATGEAIHQGRDAVTHFERDQDAIVILNGSAEVSPGVSYNSVAEGIGPHGGFEETIGYRLVYLEFVGGAPVETPVAPLGQLSFVDFV